MFMIMACCMVLNELSYSQMPIICMIYTYRSCVCVCVYNHIVLSRCTTFHQYTVKMLHLSADHACHFVVCACVCNHFVRPIFCHIYLTDHVIGVFLHSSAVTFVSLYLYAHPQHQLFCNNHAVAILYSY